jgi:hypothetical protein
MVERVGFVCFVDYEKVGKKIISQSPGQPASRIRLSFIIWKVCDQTIQKKRMDETGNERCSQVDLCGAGGWCDLFCEQLKNTKT